MHDTAFRIGTLAMQVYTQLESASILEIGAQIVNGSLRSSALPTTKYLGVDIEEGEGVDLVVNPGEPLPLDDGQFDLVMATSVFEHDMAFWRTFLEMCRKAKPGGHIYISAPSNGKVHRYPRDCWRFYPDAGSALKMLADSEELEVTLVESFIAEREQDEWNDFCAIFRREPSKKPLPTDFVYQRVPCANAVTWQSADVHNEREQTEDQILTRRQREHAQHLEHLLHLSHSERAAWGAEREVLARNAAEGRIAEERAALILQDCAARAEQSAKEIEGRDRELLARGQHIQALEREASLFKAEKSALLAQLREVEGKLADASQQLLDRQHKLSSVRAVVRDQEIFARQRDRELQWLANVHEVLRISTAGWRGFMPTFLLRRYQFAALRRRGLFDSSAYLERYPDVAKAGFDPLVHYIKHGIYEGREPGVTGV